jgi:structural maintenance of chromosome 3 (chondroitin sulfate proteoglycan 6)
MPTAVRYSREYGLHCVTLDGDKVDRKGALTGGLSSGSQRSRMKCVQQLIHTRDSLRALTQSSEKTQQVATNADQEVGMHVCG